MRDTNETSDIAGAVKYDGGKAPIFKGGLGYFPSAIEAVSSVSQFGATKYAWNGWRHVPDGLNRYTDAMVRHLASEAKGEAVDPDSGLPHAWHTAWNALARLELILREEREQDEKARTYRQDLMLKDAIPHQTGPIHETLPPTYRTR